MIWRKCYKTDKQGQFAYVFQKIVTFDNSMLSILKVNNPPAAEDRVFRMGALYMEKHLKNAAWQCSTQRF